MTELADCVKSRTRLSGRTWDPVATMPGTFWPRVPYTSRSAATPRRPHRSGLINTTNALAD